MSSIPSIEMFGSLSDVRSQLFYASAELDAVETHAKVMERTAALSGDKNYLDIVEEFRRIEDAHVAKLRVERGDLGEIRFLQGALSILAIMTSRDTPSPEELAQIRNRVTMLRKRVDHFRGQLPPQ